MTISMAAPVLVMIVGLVMFLMLPPNKPCEVGKWMFICGLLATLFAVAGKSLHISG